MDKKISIIKFALVLQVIINILLLILSQIFRYGAYHVLSNIYAVLGGENVSLNSASRMQLRHYVLRSYSFIDIYQIYFAISIIISLFLLKLVVDIHNDRGKA